MYSYRKEIHWDSISSAAAGKYVCQSVHIKDNRIENRTLVLTILESERPEITETNFENEMVSKHLLAEPFQLQCKFNGFPYPKITWLKDEREVVPEERIELHDNSSILDIHFIKAEDAGEYRCVGENRIGLASQRTTLQVTST